MFQLIYHLADIQFRMKRCELHPIIMLGLIFVRDHGIRLYASLPSTNTSSKIARAQAELWTNEIIRKHVAIKIYSMSFF